LIVEKAEMLKAESGNQVSLLTSNLNGICPAVPGRRAAGDGGLSIAGRPVLFLELCRPQTWQAGRIKKLQREMGIRTWQRRVSDGHWRRDAAVTRRAGTAALQPAAQPPPI